MTSVSGFGSSDGLKEDRTTAQQQGTAQLLNRIGELIVVLPSALLSARIFYSTMLTLSGKRMFRIPRHLFQDSRW